MLVKYGDNAAANRMTSLANADFQKLYPNWPVMLESYLRANYNFRTRYPVYNSMSDALGVEISEMMLGHKTPKEAVDAVQKQLEDELARQK
jgi:ABC-type glycerol-3-phosphate transport system substrate-binding protein